jgi:hypothetical protein
MSQQSVEGGTYPPRLPDAVRRWKSITVHLPDWLLTEFGEIAKALGMSRVALIRDALLTAGLAYARGLLKGRGAEQSKTGSRVA